MFLDLKEDFDIIENGVSYNVPEYHVVEGEGLVVVPNGGAEINFVRGSTRAADGIEAHTGTLHEHLLAVQIHDLKYKMLLVPSRETEMALASLEVALMWLRQRTIDRAQRQVAGTYQK